MTNLVYIEIADEPIIPGSVYDGKARPSRQNAYAHTGKRHPLPFTVKVPDNGPYRPGRYLIAGDVFKTGQFGLEFRTGNMELVEIGEALKALNGPALKAAS